MSLKYFLSLLYMTKHYKKRMHTKSKRGGSSHWTSGTTYEMANYGTANQQYQSVFGPNPAPNAYGNFLVNQLKPEASLLPDTVSKTAGNLIGGRYSKRSHIRHKKGGFLGQVLNQAVVPFGLAALQQSYKRNRGFMPKNTQKNFRKNSRTTRRRRRY